MGLLYLGDGEEGFSRANAELTGVANAASAMGDVNNDGNDDLLITGETSSGIYFLRLRADGQTRTQKLTIAR